VHRSTCPSGAALAGGFLNLKIKNMSAMKKILDNMLKREGHGDRVDTQTNQSELVMEAIVWVALLSLCFLV
jgi:hypothetical protein